MVTESSCMPVPLRVHAATHVGLVHETNEDSWAVTPTEEGGLLLLVCDGMGGMGRGDEASALAATTITEALEKGTGLPPERMRRALREADRVVRERLCSGTPGGNPGSTAVLAYVIDGVAHIAWAGDSRAYLLRDDRVLDRTRDHKLVNDLIDAGKLAPEDAADSDFSHVVTRALGGRGAGEPDVRPDTLRHPWKLLHGDTLVLCSDGLCDLVDDDELPMVIQRLPPDRATEALVEIALERGGHDNITAIVAHWEGSSYQEDDVATPVMRPERRHLPDLRLDMPELDPELDESPRVTEEIERDELERLVGATPPPSPAEAPQPPPPPVAEEPAGDDPTPPPSASRAEHDEPADGARPPVWVAIPAAAVALLALAAWAWMR
jgi:protein phosphatase